jgi:hypothetical protein
MRLFKLSYTVLLSLFLFSCGNKGNTPKIGELDFGEVNPDKSITKTMTIDFNTAAQSDPNAFLEFEFVSTDGKPLNDISFKIMGRTTSGNKFKIKHADLDPNHKVEIEILFSQNAKEKDYNGYLMLINSSEDLKQNITYGDAAVVKNLHEQVGVFHAKYVIPMASWLFWTILILSVLIVIGTVVFILTRDNMPFGKKTFKYGTIGFPSGESSSVKLEKLAVYDISKAFGLDAGITLEPYYKKVNGKERRMARIRNKSNLVVTILFDGTEQIIGVTEDLYNMDEVKITTTDNKICHISYTNNKNVRSTI